MPEQPRSPADDVPRTGLDFVRERAGELAEALEARAERIGRELAGFYTYTPVDGFLARFEELHEKHVRELHAGRVAPAHRVLNGIHDVSFELEWKEFWTDREINHPDAVYELADDAFTRGPLICAYLVGDMRSYSPLYAPAPPCLGPGGSWLDPPQPQTPAQKVQAAARCYGLMLDSIGASPPG